jgi:polyhydroxyalkanoate synthesis regulator phasin
MAVFITTKSATRMLTLSTGQGDMQMSSKKKVIAVAVTTVALTAGSFGVATAASKTTKVTQTSTRVVSNTTNTGKPDRGAELTALLSTLVAKGTITQAQADAIIAANTAADAARDALRPAKDGINVGFDQKLALIASTLGTDTKTVLTRLQAGETLATIAGAKKEALIAALVADETKRIDAAVTAGTITADQAKTLKANLVAHVTDEVNSTRPVGGKGGFGGKGGRGHGGPNGGGMMGGAAPTIPAPSATTSAN